MAKVSFRMGPAFLSWSSMYRQRGANKLIGKPSIKCGWWPKADNVHYVKYEPSSASSGGRFGSPCWTSDAGERSLLPVCSVAVVWPFLGEDSIDVLVSPLPFPPG